MQEYRLAQESDHRVQIYVTREMSFNIEKMFQITRSVLGKLGCDGCHSGRILDFKVVEDYVVNPKTLDVNEIVVGNQF